MLRWVSQRSPGVAASRAATSSRATSMLRSPGSHDTVSA